LKSLELINALHTQHVTRSEEFFLQYSYKKKSKLRSGDLASQRIEPYRPNQRSGNCWFKKCV